MCVDLFLLAAVHSFRCLREIIDGARKKFGFLKAEVTTGSLCRSCVQALYFDATPIRVSKG